MVARILSVVCGLGGLALLGAAAYEAYDEVWPQEFSVPVTELEFPEFPANSTCAVTFILHNPHREPVQIVGLPGC
jgi:hypothetical protein